MKFTSVQKAFIALIIANIIWGAASPIFKLSLQNIPPFTLAFWRFAIGSFLLLIIFRKKVRMPIHASGDRWLLIFNAVSGITINIIFFFWGLQLTQSINAPVIASSAPIITMLFAMSFLKERFRLRKIAGMILGTIGILLIVFEPLLEAGLDGSVLGNVFLVIATLAAVGGTISGRRLFTRYDPFSLSFWSFVIGAMSFLPLAAYEYIGNPGLYAALDIRGYTGIIFGGLLSTTLAYTLYNWGLSKISATDTAMFTYIDPVVGAFLGYLLLHEPITILYLVGFVLIFGGIFLAEGRIHYHPFNKLRKIMDLPPS